MIPPVSANKTGFSAFILAKSRRETLKGRRGSELCRRENIFSRRHNWIFALSFSTFLAESSIFLRGSFGSLAGMIGGDTRPSQIPIIAFNEMI
jgi:hypothetical protein